MFLCHNRTSLDLDHSMRAERKTARKVARSNGAQIKATSFQTVTFFDEKQQKQIVLLYTLGSDGIVREYQGDHWHPYPIT
jgi:hypothetical protein